MFPISKNCFDILYMILTLLPPLVPDLGWACWRSEEAVQGWTPTGGLHTLIILKKAQARFLYLLRSVLLTSDWPNFTSLSGRTGNNLDQHLFCFKKSIRRWIKIIPASRAVTTTGARRFAPSKSILIRLGEFRRIEARHSDTTFETKNIIHI